MRSQILSNVLRATARPSIVARGPIFLRSASSDAQEGGTRLSFSNVEYEDVAKLIGLKPRRYLADIETFELSRARIPTSLFRSILDDMDIVMRQYGPIFHHLNQEATSRYMAPIFNRLVAAFGFAFRNHPESLVEGCIATQGKVNYLKSFGAIACLFVEIKGVKERAKAIAQVIAECDACDWNNKKDDLAVTVYVILTDGSVVEFFQFDGFTRPCSFKRGTLPNDPRSVRYGFKFDDPSLLDSSLPFIRQLRPICEMIFGLLLTSYISSLDAYYRCSVVQANKEGKPGANTEQWETPLALAHKGKEMFQDAEMKREAGLINEANQLVEEGMDILNASVHMAVPRMDKFPPITRDWDKNIVEKM